MKKVTIGLIGFGTVGSGVYDLITENAPLIEERTGIKIIIKTICDIRIAHVKSLINDSAMRLTGRWEDITEDPEIDTVIELIGGIEPAKSIILSSLKNGKNVVTANKKLLAEDGREIFEQAIRGGKALGFEASVAGGIPCILTLEKGLVANRVKSIMGILNGTTNYILSQMELYPLTFEETLKDAQEKGFAEADPTADIEGHDAGHKITLLATIAFRKKINFATVPVEGITGINQIDINYARDMGYTIKLLGIAKDIEGKLDIRVHPTMIPLTHPLASVHDEYNAVFFDCDMTEPIFLHGKGAGSFPTASAIMSDVIRIAESDSIMTRDITLDAQADIIESSKRVSRYYLRVLTEDTPGILSKISGVLGDHAISISSVIQEEMHSDMVPLIFMTHETKEEAVTAAKNELSLFPFVHGDITIIRVEDTLD